MERRKNVAEIKKFIQEKRESCHSMPSLTRFLISKGFSKSIAEEINTEFVQSREEIASLQEIIAKKIRVSGNVVTPKKLACVGPPGIGKTSFIVKLARYYHKMGQQVVILTLETNELKAKIFLDAHVKKLHIPVFEKWQSFSDYDILLIDTPGCNFYNPMEIDILAEKLFNDQDIEVLLILSAASKEVDLYGAIHQFSPFSPTNLGITKLDETLTLGTLVNLSQRTDLPIRFVSYGHAFMGEVHIADPYEITHKILTELNKEELHFLRQLVNSE